MQIYVEDDGDKVSMVEKGEHIEFINAVDFDSVFDFSGSFVFSDVSDFLHWRYSREVLTLYKKKVDKVQPVSRPHEGGLRPGGKGNWCIEAILKEYYKPGGTYAGWCHEPICAKTDYPELELVEHYCMRKTSYACNVSYPEPELELVNLLT